MTKYIIKSTGEKERFSVNKLKRSLRKAGASPDAINEVIRQVLAREDLDTTKKIYSFAYNLLKSLNRPTAARYSLKHALYELGPEGFYFEKFVELLFKEQGFSTRKDVILSGACVDHEIDVLARKDNNQFMVECKFHNHRGTKTDVKAALYVNARYLDLAKKWHQISRDTHDGAYLVTNTQFTSEATKYGSCVGLRMLGWAYPHDAGIATLIDDLEMHPITTLTGLSKKQKRLLLARGVLLCRDLIKRPHLLNQLGIRTEKSITDECKELCPSLQHN